MSSTRLLVITTVLSFLLLLSIGAPSAWSADEAGGSEPRLAVIVNNANGIESISTDELARIYTNNVLKWPDGTPIRIYDLVVTSPLRLGFSEKVLGRSPERVAEEWAHLKITNQAKNPPQTIKSETLIIKRVSREKGAIGYVSLDRVRGAGSVRVVATIY